MSRNSSEPIRHTASATPRFCSFCDHAVEQDVATEAEPGDHEQPDDEDRDTDRTSGFPAPAPGERDAPA